MTTTTKTGTNNATRTVIKFVLFWIVFISIISIYSFIDVVKNNITIKENNLPPLEYIEVL